MEVVQAMLAAEMTARLTMGNGCNLYSARISALGVIQPDRKGSFASLMEFDLKDIFVILEIRVACKDGPAAS